MKRTILIVEDSPLSRALLAEILGAEYAILEAQNGAEAIRMLERRSRTISAVLLDLMMPVTDGYEVLSRRRDNVVWSQIPFIVTTAADEEEAKLKALSLGANEFVAKPYNAALLLNSLRNAIDLCEKAAIINSINFDTLTGIYSREGFFLYACELIKAQEPGYYMLSAFDIDRFKIINDQYGNNKGDIVLKSIASILENSLEPQGGICCRIAADNFAALYPKSLDGTETDVEMKRRLVKADSSIPYISYSAGMYSVDDVSLPVASMYDRAVMAKMSIKGRYDVHIAWYDDSMRERVLHEQTVVNEMHSALAKGQFETWFQPQYNHATGAMIGAEALVRWRRAKDGSIIPPSEFISVFERNGFIYEMDKFVWEQSCALLRKWRDAGYSPLPVSVNISRQDVYHDDFFDVITGLVTKYGIPAGLLRLEVTESAFSQYPQQIVAIVKRLIAFGFEVEIDDFGSGYSSLNTLKDVPASILKLDMKFLESSEDSQRGGNIIQSIIRMSKWLGMAVIAEGVESREQADYLKSIGCCYVQGYYYAKPMPSDEYERLIRDNKIAEKLLVMETVKNLDNNAFWDPGSMDTLIFNSYIGGACIFEYHEGEIELLRANDKYISEFGNKIAIEEVYNFDIYKFLDAQSMDTLLGNIRRAIDTREESACETRVVGLYGCDSPIYMRSTVRVIAQAGDRYLLYCSVKNTTEQRVAENKERELSSRISAILENINGGVTASVVSGNNVRFLFSNDQYYALLGYTKEQFEREVHDPFALVYPMDRERVISETAQASLLHQPFSINYRVTRRDGIVRWMRSNISIADFPGENEPVQLSVASDITDERENSVKMNELVNAIPGGVIIFQVSERIDALYSSEGMAKLTGRSGNDYDPRTNYDLIDSAVYEDDVSAVRERIMSAASADAPVNMTFRLKHMDAGIVWVSFSASKIRQDKKGKIYYGILTRPDTETALYQRLVEDSTTAAIIMEKSKHKILYANPAWKRLEGVPEEKNVSGVCLFDLIRGDAYLSGDSLRELPSEFYMEFHNISSIGKKVTVYARSLVWNGVDAYMCYMNDETDIWDSREQLQNLIDRVPVGIGICEVGGGKLSLSYVNDAYYSLIGYSRDERRDYLGSNAISAVYAPDRPAILDAIRKVEEGADLIELTYRTKSHVGKTLWVHIQASVVHRAEGSITVYFALTSFKS